MMTQIMWSKIGGKSMENYVEKSMVKLVKETVEKIVKNPCIITKNIAHVD